MNRRVALAKHWMFTNRNQVGLGELMSNVFATTCSMKAKPCITRIAEERDCRVVSLRGLEWPVYYPKSMSLRSLHQVITESFYPSQWHYFEIPETTVGPQDVVVDCGAAEGLFSLMVANRCAKVFAIEPLPMFQESLRHTLGGFRNATILPFALADSPGEAFMDESDISSTISAHGDVPVQVETMDRLFFEQGIAIDYLKADLEGYELKMLDGARETIRANTPKIAITTYHRAEHAREIERFLLELNPAYRVKVKGIEERAGAPVMLHAWIPQAD